MLTTEEGGQQELPALRRLSRRFGRDGALVEARLAAERELASDTAAQLRREEHLVQTMRLDIDHLGLARCPVSGAMVPRARLEEHTERALRGLTAHIHREVRTARATQLDARAAELGDAAAQLRNDAGHGPRHRDPPTAFATVTPPRPRAAGREHRYGPAVASSAAVAELGAWLRGYGIEEEVAMSIAEHGTWRMAAFTVPCHTPFSRAQTVAQTGTRQHHPVCLVCLPCRHPFRCPRLPTRASNPARLRRRG
jgi:hypothetical protein|eukprot:SAG25_NODE_124_length_14606_cov_739.419177_18_plen_253_part_00